MSRARARLFLLALLAVSACDGAATRPDAGPTPDARRIADAAPGSVDAEPGTSDAAPGSVDAAPSPADARVCPASVGGVMDGALDDGVDVIAGGDTSPRLAVAIGLDGVLYVATDDAGEGSDHFLLLSATAPGDRTLGAPFAKAGTVAAGTGDLLFLADENDNGFTGWFRREDGAGDTLLDGAGFTSATGANGGVLEGHVDLAAAFGAVPTTLYLAVGVYGNGDGGALVPEAQTPAGDGDGDVEATEFMTFDATCVE